MKKEIDLVDDYGIDFKKIEKELALMTKSYIEVGIFTQEGSNLFFKAFASEYGVNITVSEKMRKYLAVNGFLVKKSTKTLRIPKRSYLRSYFDEKEWINIGKTIVDGVVLGNLTANQALNQWGMFMVGGIQRKITETKKPPLHPFTINQKGSTKPLIDTGELRNSINYKIVTI